MAVLAGSPMAAAGCTPQPAAEPEPGTKPPPSRSGGSPTAADFAWFEQNDELTAGFCFTWVRELSAQEVLTRLRARDLGTHPWRPDGWFDLPGQRRGEVVVAVTEVGGWAFLVEDSGFLGIEADVVRKLSRGTRLVSTYRNVEHDGQFLLAENGVVRVAFDPAYPAGRAGTEPDRLLPDMTASGLDPAPADTDVPATEAAFALVQRITGVPFTAGLLHEATYRVGALPDPLPPGAVREDQELRTYGS